MAAGLSTLTIEKERYIKNHFILVIRYYQRGLIWYIIFGNVQGGCKHSDIICFHIHFLFILLRLSNDICEKTVKRSDPKNLLGRTVLSF